MVSSTLAMAHAHMVLAPALALHTMTGLPIWATILTTGTLATLYTIKGGMAAVLYTDFVQSIVMIGCAVTMLGVCISRLDRPLFQTLKDIHGEVVPEKFWHLHPTRSSPPAESFYSMLIGYTFLNLAQLATDQIAVQRYLTASSAAECKRSLVLNGCCQGCFTLLMCFLGWSLSAYFHQGGRQDPLGNHTLSSKDQISPYFALTQMPHGFGGLLVAAILGSTMSVFSGGVNAAATCVVVDILQGAMQKDIPEWQIVRTSRIISGVIATVAIVLAFAASAVKGLVKMGVIATCMSTPLLGLFLLGMFSSRTSAKGALAALTVGFVTVIYLAAANIVCGTSSHLCHAHEFFSGGLVSIFWFGTIGTLSTVLTGVVTWAICEPPPPSFILGLTYGSRQYARADSGSNLSEVKPLVGTLN